MKNFLFGERCDMTWCFKRPWNWMVVRSHGKEMRLGYCEHHARTLDAMMRRGEIIVPNVETLAYHPLNRKAPTVITEFPGQAVDRHLKLYGHLPADGCCEHDQALP